MKKIYLFMTSILVLSNYTYANDNAISSNKILSTITAIDNSSFYIGFGFGSKVTQNSYTKEQISDNTALLQVGYQFNNYTAIEGRTSKGFNTSYDYGILTPREYNGDFYSWGIYLKPMYTIDGIAIYALLGYGGIEQKSLDSGDAYASDFRWGLGVSYTFTKQMTIFVDYISLYHATGFDYRAKDRDIDSGTYSLGLSYKF